MYVLSLLVVVAQAYYFAQTVAFGCALKDLNRKDEHFNLQTFFTVIIVDKYFDLNASNAAFTEYEFYFNFVIFYFNYLQFIYSFFF